MLGTHNTMLTYTLPADGQGEGERGGSKFESIKRGRIEIAIGIAIDGVSTPLKSKTMQVYEKRRADVVGPFPMHQDWQYGPMRNDTMVSGMIHVAKTTTSMGALRIYPGTHRTRMENALFPLLSGARVDVERNR